jgi:putative transposase
VALIADGLNVQVACDLAGVSQATHYRRMNPPALSAAPIPQKDRVQPATLTTEETGRIVGFLVDEENADLSVNEVFFRCWEDGIHIASLSAWQRIARARNLTGDRRRLATHKPRAIPVLCASRPNMVWSWDITTLPSIDRGRSFKLFVILDVFSRYVVGWRIEDTENGPFAVEMLTDTIVSEGAIPEVLHADRGSPMTSDVLTAALANFDIVQSHSRPRVSNDNPFSEAQFKTCKYSLDYPRRFRDIEHARQWVAEFMHRYNHQNHHSGIGYYTPMSVHDGSWIIEQNLRQDILDAAFAANPARYARRPHAPTVHAESWINYPTQTETQTAA